LSLITKETNNKIINNKNPSKYIKDFEDIFREKQIVDVFYYNLFCYNWLPIGYQNKKYKFIEVVKDRILGV